MISERFVETLTQRKEDGMVDCRFEVRLKQHTPMIHFQHDQAGATLRATEVKPKLDAFLKEKLKLEQKVEELKQYTGNQGNLLYRLRISPNPKGAVVKPIERQMKDRNGNVLKKRNGDPRLIGFPNFFGNMGEGKEKCFVQHRNVTFHFFSYRPALLDHIKKHLSEFLFRQNFGTRQSKGFGSFYVEASDPIYSAPLAKFYKFTVNAPKGDFYAKYETLFEHINLFYKTIRSGINLKNREGRTLFYFKSLLFLYAKSEKNWTWDKRLIKNKFIRPNRLRDQKNAHPNSDLIRFEGSEGYMVRDLLGLAPVQEFMSERFALHYDEKQGAIPFSGMTTYQYQTTLNRI
jgi:hypothetical protein